ncbi:MAG: bifunctional O-acetylhomoserine aminocarboxypropyltransferase/cysteine synthase, partial [Bacteroidetes bacterium]
SFTLKKGKDAAIKLVESLKLVSHLANLGDAKTLIIQPSATTHQQLSDEEQIAAGVLPSGLRVSVGLEHIDDLINDFKQAFENIS